MSLPPEEIAYQEAHINDNKQTGLTVVYILALVVSTVAVALRFWARRISNTALKADDWSVVIALITFYALVGTGIYQIHVAGLGKHIITLQPEQVVIWLKYDIIWSSLYTPSIIGCKVSLLLLYLRIFVTPTFKLLVKCTLGFVAAVGISFWITTLMICVPLTKYWYPDVPGHCIDSYRYYLAGAALNVLIDLIILILPMPVIWSLQMPTKQQLWVSGIFALGFLSTITTIIRITSFVHLDLLDITYSWVDSAYWTNCAEVPTAFLCACLPAMGPLLRNFRPTSTPKGSYGKGGSHSWSGTTNKDSKNSGRWISLSKKSDHGSELDTINQAENGIFIPSGASGFGNTMGNKMDVWTHDDLRASDGDNVPLQPKAIYVQKEVKVNRTED